MSLIELENNVLDLLTESLKIKPPKKTRPKDIKNIWTKIK